MAGDFPEMKYKAQAEAPIPDDVSLLELADQVVRGKIKLNPQQTRMLIEMLPYVAPKLLAVGHGSFNDMAFANRLDRAIDRTKKVREPKQKLLEDLRGRR